MVSLMNSDDMNRPDCEQRLNAAFEEYFNACYKGQFVTKEQRRKVKHAFLYGVGWSIMHGVQYSETLKKTLDRFFANYKEL